MPACLLMGKQPAMMGKLVRVMKLVALVKVVKLAQVVVWWR
jgi:hypothetical protein